MDGWSYLHVSSGIMGDVEAIGEDWLSAWLILLT
jgi:hypothetical protein